ncbi:MAG: hypothetical protein QM755_19860 [Luteolibacter sp.]
MSPLIRLENTTQTPLTVQVELTGMERLLLPGEIVLVNTDQPDGPPHVQIAEQRVIVWGGVAAEFADE